MDNYLKALLDNFGEALKNDVVVQEYLVAREAYVNDTEMTGAVSEYNVQRMLLEEQKTQPEQDENLIKSMETRVNALYEKIMASESMKALAVAENKLNELLNEVNQTIMSYIMPPSDCSGNCHDCHGCH